MCPFVCAFLPVPFIIFSLPPSPACAHTPHTHLCLYCLPSISQLLPLHTIPCCTFPSAFTGCCIYWFVLPTLPALCSMQGPSAPTAFVPAYSQLVTYPFVSHATVPGSPPPLSLFCSAMPSHLPVCPCSCFPYPFPANTLAFFMPLPGLVLPTSGPSSAFCSPFGCLPYPSLAIQCSQTSAVFSVALAPSPPLPFTLPHIGMDITTDMATFLMPYSSYPGSCTLPLPYYITASASPFTLLLGWDCLRWVPCLEVAGNFGKTACHLPCLPLAPPFVHALPLCLVLTTRSPTLPAFTACCHVFTVCGPLPLLCLGLQFLPCPCYFPSLPYYASPCIVGLPHPCSSQGLGGGGPSPSAIYLPFPHPVCIPLEIPSAHALFIVPWEEVHTCTCLHCHLPLCLLPHPALVPTTTTHSVLPCLCLPSLPPFVVAQEGQRMPCLAWILPAQDIPCLPAQAVLFPTPPYYSFLLPPFTFYPTGPHLPCLAFLVFPFCLPPNIGGVPWGLCITCPLPCPWDFGNCSAMPLPACSPPHPALAAFFPRTMVYVHYTTCAPPPGTVPPALVLPPACPYLPHRTPSLPSLASHPSLLPSYHSLSVFFCAVFCLPTYPRRMGPCPCSGGPSLAPRTALPIPLAI